MSDEARKKSRRETRKKLRRKLRESWESLDPIDFEHKIEELYKSLGYEAKVTPAGNDGGIDVVLHQSGQTILVQCKKYQAPNKCTPDIAHKLAGVMSLKGITEGKLVCSSGFTGGVKNFVDELKSEQGINIELVDIHEILEFDLKVIEAGLEGRLHIHESRDDEGRLKDDKKTTYYKNGKKKTESHYKNDERDGLSTEWYENGKKKSDTHYKAGKLEGLQTRWYENGKKEEGHWKDDWPDGLWTEWHRNGKKKSEYHYKAGKLDGPDIRWYENGKKKWEFHHKNGKRDGRAIVWHENGEKQWASHYRDGKEEGRAIYWHENGRKQKEIQYMDGEEVSREEF